MVKGGELMCVYKIDEIKEIITPIAKTYKLSKIYLFGSYARQSATEESDVDLLIEGFADTRFLAFPSFYSELETALKKSIDIVQYESFNEGINKQDEFIQEFRKKIIKEQILLYEQ